MTAEDQPPDIDISRMVNIEFYPDIIRMGGLSEAVLDTAEENNIELKGIRGRGGAARFVTVEFVEGDNSVSILLAVDRRKFSITVSRGQHISASGGTDSLVTAVQVARAWLGGTTLSELAAEFPFMRYTALALAHEEGNPLEVQWNLLLGDDDYMQIRSVLQAVYAVKGLRQLFPIVSHNTQLRLYDDMDLRAARQYWITIQDDGMYRVQMGAGMGSGKAFKSLAAAVEALTSYAVLP